MRWMVLLIAISAGLATFAGEPDLAREQRMAEQIVDAIFDGEPLELASGEHQFLAILAEAESAKGTVVILHGRGFHPDWETVVQPLRIGLTKYGWNTLSIQLPVLHKTAKYYDYVDVFPHAIPRIESALDFARQQTPEGKVVVLAHSCGTHMAHHWITHRQSDPSTTFDAYVGIGMGATDYGQKMVEPFPLAKIAVPVFDVFGEKDYPAVLRLAEQRLQLIGVAGNTKSAQQGIPGATHYFQGHEDQLTEVVGQWLDTL